MLKGVSLELQLQAERRDCFFHFHSHQDNFLNFLSLCFVKGWGIGLMQNGPCEGVTKQSRKWGGMSKSGGSQKMENWKLLQGKTY